ncbi:MAG: VOC family protein [Cetobacterium sp.]|uniref:VOC family protein n=1 Tax=Cetobacterium sp. TaxID=2071632 RepID=UPI002FC8BBBB
MRVHHICIQTSKYNESMDFYMNTLGFNLVKETKGFHGREYNTWLELNNFYIELQTPKTDEKTDYKEKDGIVHVCFYVDNIDEKLEEILKTYKNFKLKNGKVIYEVEGGKLFKVIAPEGTIIEVRDREVY